MDVIVKGPGWEPWTWPDHPEVSAELKRLTYLEGLGMVTDFSKSTDDGYYGEAAQNYFRKYVRNIAGLNVNGVAVKSPDQILDPSMGQHPALLGFYVAAIMAFFRINTLSEVDSKNSDGPSEERK